jgi:hypothetical protein
MKQKIKKILILFLSVITLFVFSSIASFAINFDEQEPNDEGFYTWCPNNAMQITLGDTVNGEFDTGEDSDWYKVDTKGFPFTVRITLETYSAEDPSAVIVVTDNTNERDRPKDEDGFAVKPTESISEFSFVPDKINEFWICLDPFNFEKYGKTNYKLDVFRGARIDEYKDNRNDAAIYFSEGTNGAYPDYYDPKEDYARHYETFDNKINNKIANFNKKRIPTLLKNIRVFSSGKELSKSDFTVSLTNKTKVGPSVLTIIAKNDYYGTYKMTIDKYLDNPWTKKRSDIKINAKAKTISLKVIKPYGGNKIKYKIKYKFPGMKKWKEKGSSTNIIKFKNVKKLQSGKFFKIRIMAYTKIGNKIYYSGVNKHCNEIQIQWVKRYKFFRLDQWEGKY